MRTILRLCVCALLSLIVVPSFAAGLIFGRSHLTAAYWGITAEALGLILAAIPISVGERHTQGLSLAMMILSLLIGGVAGALGFISLRLVKR